MSEINRLSAVKATKETRRGLHADGLGLYLQVSKAGAKSWIYRYRVGSKLRSMGLGSFHAVPLARAREKAAVCRSQRAEGIDPLADREMKRAKARSDRLSAVTFEACAAAYIESHRASWKNPKHAAQWGSTLATYVFPVIGRLPVSQIDQTHVCAVLEPIWQEKPETASRVRGRIESVLDHARVRGHRVGENPAWWRGHLDKLLPHRSELRPVEHHAALAYDTLPAFMVRLAKEEGTAARALEFCILTCARTNEALGARWDEVVSDKAYWHLPAGRMKNKREHRVPLSPSALNLVHRMETQAVGPYVFPGQREGKSLSGMAMTMLLRRMGVTGITVHGFRSTFRDWAAEQTSTPSDIVEMALAHTNPNKVEAAYKRSDVFEKRRLLANEWASFCTSLTLRAAASASWSSRISYAISGSINSTASTIHHEDRQRRRHVRCGLCPMGRHRTHDGLETDQGEAASRRKGERAHAGHAGRCDGMAFEPARRTVLRRSAP